MDVLIVYPENKEQLDTLKLVIKSMRITFEKKNLIYPDNVVNGVRESLLEANNRHLTPYDGVEKMLSGK